MQRAEQRSLPVAPAVTVVRRVFSVAFPPGCRIWSLPLSNISRLRVFEECLDSIEPIQVPQCVQCGERLLPSQLLAGDRRCHGCREFDPEFDRAVSFGAFRVTDPERVKGRTVIVVDDVMTTGTTVSECARVLKKAGAERVWAATLARTLKKAVLPVSVERGKQEESEAAEMAVSV